MNDEILLVRDLAADPNVPRRLLYWMALAFVVIAGLRPAVAFGAAESVAACALPPPTQLSRDPQWLQQDVEVLFDPRRDYTPQQLVRAPLCRQFWPIRGSPAFGYERRGIWLRWRLAPAAGMTASLRLLVPQVGTDRICVHWPVRPSGYRTECGDIREPKGAGPFAAQGWDFPVPAMIDSSRAVLLFAQGMGDVQVPLQFGTAKALLTDHYVTQAWHGAFYGLLLGAALLGLAMFVNQKDRTYLYYAGYIVAFMLYVATHEGHLAPWGLGGSFTLWANLPAGALSALLVTSFFQRLLETRVYTPQLHRLATITVMLTILAVGLLMFQVPFAVLVISGMAASWLVAMTAIGVRRTVQGSRPAVYALGALTFLLVGGVFRLLEFSGLHIVDVQVSRHLLHVSLLMTAGLLLASLADRLRGLAQERDRASALALHRAQYDELTRLANRSKFQDDLREVLIEAARTSQRVALVTLGLDRFGAINHTLGRLTGDRVLEEVVVRIRRCMPAGALLARTGPDLFACSWVLETGGDDSVEKLCASLLTALEVPLRSAQDATLTASLGIALYPDHSDSAERLVQGSDSAMHHAKRRGGGQVEMFVPTMHRAASRELEMAKDLRRALAQGQLELHYQPIVALATGQVLGAEALARWRLADGRLVPPEEFIPVAERGDLLRPFAEWTVEGVSRQLADWHARHLAVSYLSFNLSAAQLRFTQLDELILHWLAHAHVSGKALALEVTEGALLENIDVVRTRLSRLRAQGMTVAIDDYGIGYASPNYLRMLPVDILKIDQSFLRGVPAVAEATSLLNGIIDIGLNLKLKVVIEGVETESQRAYLAGRGVTAGQGYCFSRALPPAEFEAWVQQHPAKAA